MGQLRKIMKEIGEEKRHVALSPDHSNEYAVAQIRMAEKIENIIFNNMDDGWIPVNLRLPKEKGVYLVTYHPCYWDNVEAEVRVGIDTFRGKTAWAQRKYQRVIAWRPLPEPYFPERSDNHDGE